MTGPLFPSPRLSGAPSPHGDGGNWDTFFPLPLRERVAAKGEGKANEFVP